jgi:hypothetical protein
MIAFNAWPRTTAARQPWYRDLRADALVGKKVVDKDGCKAGALDELVCDSKDYEGERVTGIGGFKHPRHRALPAAPIGRR